MHALGGARKAPGLRDRKTNLRTRSRDSPIYENEQIDDAKRAPKHLEVESQIGIPSSFDLVINVAITTVTNRRFFGASASSIRCSTALTASCLLFACSVCVDLSNDVDHFQSADFDALSDAVFYPAIFPSSCPFP